MKILGYSERGIINSLIFSIVESNDNDLMGEFIALIDIPEISESEKPIDYEMLLEQSFSDFGDADLVIIMEYKSGKKALFIEGKVKTYKPKTWDLYKQYKRYEPKKKYPGYSSNLFYQLYLKSLLFENKIKLLEQDNYVVNCGIRDRKIGGNPIVRGALEKIAECKKAYYIGLVPSSKDKNVKFKEALNSKTHFLSWEQVEDFCIKKELKKVKEIFDYNKGQIYKIEN